MSTGKDSTTDTTGSGEDHLVVDENHCPDGSGMGMNMESPDVEISSETHLTNEADPERLPVDEPLLTDINTPPNGNGADIHTPLEDSALCEGETRPGSSPCGGTESYPPPKDEPQDINKEENGITENPEPIHGTEQDHPPEMDANVVPERGNHAHVNLDNIVDGENNNSGNADSNVDDLPIAAIQSLPTESDPPVQELLVEPSEDRNTTVTTELTTPETKEALFGADRKHEIAAPVPLQPPQPADAAASGGGEKEEDMSTYQMDSQPISTSVPCVNKEIDTSTENWVSASAKRCLAKNTSGEEEKKHDDDLACYRDEGMKHDNGVADNTEEEKKHENKVADHKEPVATAVPTALQSTKPNDAKGRFVSHDTTVGTPRWGNHPAPKPATATASATTTSMDTISTTTSTAKPGDNNGQGYNFQICSNSHAAMTKFHDPVLKNGKIKTPITEYVGRKHGSTIDKFHTPVLTGSIKNQLLQRNKWVNHGKGDDMGKTSFQWIRVGGAWKKQYAKNH